MQFPDWEFDEHMMVELKDGRLWMLARTKGQPHESFSSDGGKTWSERRWVGETAPGTNQVYAWMSVSPDGGRLDLIYNDLGYDPAGYLVDVSYAWFDPRIRLGEGEHS